MLRVAGVLHVNFVLKTGCSDQAEASSKCMGPSSQRKGTSHRKREQSWEIVRVLPRAVGGSALSGTGLRLYSLVPVFVHC